MEEEKNIKTNVTGTQSDGEQMKLDDARRVKVLSPAMLVFKRFVRNKLAITGFIIIVVMFAFAFLGPVFSPYGQSEVFKGTEYVSKDYATAIFNTEMRFTDAEGEKLGSGAKSEAQLAMSKGTPSFTSGDEEYFVEKHGDDFYAISKLTSIASVLTAGKLAIVEPAEGFTIDPALNSAIESAVASGAGSFEEAGVEYTVLKNGKKFSISTAQPVALATRLVYDAYDPADSAFVSSYDFKYACLEAYSSGANSFEVDGKSYKLEIDDEKSLIYTADGKEFASISDIIVETAATDITLSLDFKTAVRDAVSSKTTEFTVPGSDQKYLVNRVNTNYYIKTDTATELIRMYEVPSSEHILGLDGNGMDVLTRLMYGGRVSLLVGFVVVFIELFIGIIVGGISGYFGGVVDTLLMRFVDLFNSIPFWPVAIILGSVMDSLEVSSTGRIFFLMMILGVLGWTGVARVVRGQILSLREQDFMIATEATGIRVSRRIFKHLVPNVMPLLIVQATMGLGGIIITEATLSFLGLGVKYPLASWGSIINAANDIHVMTNYWFIWIPAGLLIIITVLGFNFVGDGLRDAFDPKMKR